MKLVLFFTRGMGLSDWESTGIFDREKLIYERHLAAGVFKEVIWLTYGSGDAARAAQLQAAGRLDARITVKDKPRRLSGKAGNLAYSLLMPLMHRKILRAADVLKTNQIDGSWAAVIGKRTSGRPLVVRAGFLASRDVRRRRGNSLKSWFMDMLERRAFRSADHAVVTSPEDLSYVRRTYGIREERSSCVPNYVDTDAFTPVTDGLVRERLVFVGRLSPEKNLTHLLSAARDEQIGVDLYGDGILRGELEEQIRLSGVDACLKGAVANAELPAILRQYRYYILPSLYEGMPKSLIEAMASGLVCLGTKTAGIAELINDGFDGILIDGTSPDAIRAAIRRARQADAASLGERATARIRERFSLTTIAVQDADILKRTVSG